MNLIKTCIILEFVIILAYCCTGYYFGFNTPAVITTSFSLLTIGIIILLVAVVAKLKQ